MTADRPFDPSKPVRTRDGRPARIICTDLRHPRFSIVALAQRHDGTEDFLLCTADGSISLPCPSENDLVNVHEKDIGWVNIYAHGSSHLHRSRTDADKYASPSRIACIRIEYEEGQFDE